MKPQPTLQPDPALLAAYWRAVVNPGGVHEVRAPKVRKSGPLRLFGVASGYFTDEHAFVDAVRHITGRDAEGVYLSLNPVNPALLARANNRLTDGKPITTSDADILCRRHLLIDVDPDMPAGISATETERDLALDRRDAIADLLSEIGWPAPLGRLATGNGGGLLYRIDLENTTEATALVAGALTGIKAIFAGNGAKVDTTVSNAARIAKVAGSISAKGDDLPERPWRLATAELAPDAAIVTTEQLAAVAAWAPVPTRPTGGAPFDGDIADRLRSAGIGFSEVEKGYATVYRLDRCLTSPDHADGVCILQFPSGALSYRCHHDRCQDKDWFSVRGQLGYGTTPPVEDLAKYLPPPGSGPISTAPAPSRPEWPVLDPLALHGLAGDVVMAFDPYTESDPAAILINYLTMFGSAVGAKPYVLVGDRRHFSNQFDVLVGDTSKARKGTSNDGPQSIVAGADPGWAWRVQSGLSSGEGLIWAIRDEIKQMKKGEEIVVDRGESDKRLLSIEEEFVSVSRVAARDGNTLSQMIRRAWDSKPLMSLTKNSQARCLSPHVSVIGHVTREELLTAIDSTDSANGFGNRFNWVCVRRSKLLPEGGGLPPGDRGFLVDETAKMLELAKQRAEIRRTDEAKEIWASAYSRLSAPGKGLFGAMTDRAEAHALRWSLIYALIDGSSQIEAKHLHAALALWDYCAQSARHIFGDATGDPIADRILTALRANGSMAQTEVSDLFGRNVPAARLARAMEHLMTAGLSRSDSESTGGRPKTVWRPS